MRGHTLMIRNMAQKATLQRSKSKKSPSTEYLNVLLLIIKADKYAQLLEIGII